MVTGLSRLTKVTALEILRSMFDIAVVYRSARAHTTHETRHKLNTSSQVSLSGIKAN